MRIVLRTAFILTFAMALFAWHPPVWAGVKILETDKTGKDKIKAFELQQKQRGSGPQLRLFNKDPGHPVNQFEPGELVVINPPKNFVSSIASMGFKILEALRLEGFGLVLYRLEVPKGMTVPAARKIVAVLYPGAAVDANHRYEAQARSFDARTAIGWPPATATCGIGVRLGMIDSGVDVSHPALKGQRVEFRSFHRKDRRPGPSVHGTAVATILVGRPEWGGLLPGATLKAASMFETDKNGQKVGTVIGLLKALNWLAKAKLHVINLSIAGADNRALRMVFKQAKKKGMVLVAAAGNWGRADRPAYPAAYKHVVAVTAVNIKKRIYSKANSGDYIDFSAPGVRIKTAVPGGVKAMTGTSFASPYIAAIMALEVKEGASPRVLTLKKRLRVSIDDLGIPGKDKVFGYGFVNLQPQCK